MITPTHGADVYALRRSAQEMCDTAEELIAVDLRITGRLWSLTWTGPDAMRTRQAWDNEHGPALYAAAGALARAGEKLLHEADEQEQASTADGTAGAGEIRDTVGAELGLLRTALEAVTPSPETMGQVRESVMKAVRTAGMLNNVNTAFDVVRATPGLSTALSAAGITDDMASFRAARESGDLTEQVRSGGSLLTSAPGVVNPKLGAGLNAAWNWSWNRGTAISQAMEGTRFGENFQARNDAILDTVGAWGMLATPGTLIVSGAETAWQTVSGGDGGDGDDGDSAPGVGGR